MIELYILKHLFWFKKIHPSNESYLTHARYAFSKEQETLILCGFISGCQCTKYEFDIPKGTMLLIFCVWRQTMIPYGA